MTLRAITNGIDNDHLRIVNDEGTEVAIINLFDHGEDNPRNAYTIDVIPTVGRSARAMLFGIRRDVIYSDLNKRHALTYGRVTDTEDEQSEDTRLYDSPVAVLIGNAGSAP